MDLRLLWLISRYSFRDIRRNRTFQVAFLIVLPLIFTYQLSFQSTIFNIPSEYTLVLSSFLPAQNAYLFNLLQVFPLAVVGYWVHKRNKYNTLEALWVYPYGNGIYTAGHIIGITGAFLLMGIFSLFLAGFINLVASPVSFQPLIYLFYSGTLFLPAILFTVGMVSFFSAYCFKNGSFTTLFMFVYLGVDIFYLSRIAYGVFDPLGISLPYTFSDFTGMADMTGYLLHRTSFLLLGISFILLTVSGFPRISNWIRGSQWAGSIGIFFFLAGLFMVYINYDRYKQMENRQAFYKDVYDKYAKTGKADVVAQDIHFACIDKQVEMESRLTLRNNTATSLPEIILYLNPSLKVTAIRQGVTSFPFTRDAQAIIVPRALSPGDSLTLVINYRGTIDENICYPDISEEQKRTEEANRHFLSCRFGSRYAFLEEKYILLLPECLWYPVATPPVNPVTPYNTPADFTHYTLTVEHPAYLTAISQGISKETETGTCFVNDSPQRNISLCIGKYGKREMEVDGVNYELYMAQENFGVFASVKQQKDDLAERIRDMKTTIEEGYRVAYPFKRLRFVETPLAFTSHFRLATGSSEMVQPEMLFFPERGIGLVNGQIRPFAKKGLRFENTGRKRDILKSVVLYNLNSQQVMRSREKGALAHLKLGAGWHSDLTYNLFNSNPWFFGYASSVFSSEYPILNGVFNQMIKRSWENRSPIHYQSQSHQNALDYLNGKSYRDALMDKALPVGVMNQINELKANNLLMSMIEKGVSVTAFDRFTKKFREQNRFRQTGFQTFDAAFSDTFGWSLVTLFPAFFDNRELPAFRVKNFRTKKIVFPDETEEPQSPEGTTTKYRLEFDVLNDSDVDGVISLHLESVRLQPGTHFVDKSNYEVRSFAVKAREAKRIAFIHQGTFSLTSIHTGLSKNRPDVFYINDETIIPYVKGMELTSDTTPCEVPLSASVFYPPENEIIVDNEDAGFSITDPPVSLLKRFLSKGPVENPIYFSKEIPRWIKRVSTDCFGGYCLSCVGKGTGDGKGCLTWTTPIKKKGYYRIYAYIPNDAYREEFRKSRWDKNYVIQDILYHFAIVTAEGQQKLEVSAPQTSEWVFLEEAELLPGNCSVILYDTGKPEQYVVGDAVKWEYQN